MRDRKERWKRGAIYGTRDLRAKQDDPTPSEGVEAAVSQGLPVPRSPPSVVKAPPEEKPKLSWIPGEREDYPVHYAEKKMHSFINWVEKYELDDCCDEVQALQFITDYEMVARKIIARMHWSLVYGIMKFRHPVPDQVVGLESIDRNMQIPLEAMFPIRYAQHKDLWARARVEWENIASWVQYWFDALQLEC